MKRLLQSLFTCLLTCFMLFQTSAVLGGTVHAAAWTGTIATQFASGSGTAESPWLIQNEDEFAYFLQSVNSGITFEGMYLSITADLDMTGGTLSAPTGSFFGTLNGNAHTITANVPFLHTIAINASVRLVNYRCMKTSSDEIFCQYNYGTIDSCMAYGTVSGGYYAALFCYKNGGTIKTAAARGSVSTSGSSAYSAGFVYENVGTIENAYSAVTISASSHGKYASSGKNAFVYTNNGTVTGCYYDSSITDATSAAATPTTTADLKSADMVTLLAAGNTGLFSDWIADTANVNDGYPLLLQNEKIDETITLNFNAAPRFTYHTDGFTSRFTLASDNVCSIFYTLDGTDPRTSSTRILYNPSRGVSVTGDAVIKSVACRDGLYSKIYTQEAVCIKGSGTAANPYQIADKNDLIAMSIEPDACYELTTDIVLTDEDYALGGVLHGGWPSIEAFSGTLNGNGHKIENLQGQNSFIGTNSGNIRYTRFVNLQIAANGALVNVNNGSIDHCYIDLNVEHTVGRSYTGGVVYDNNDTIAYCTVTGDLTVKGPESKYCWVYVGGIACYAGSIQYCYTDLNITVNSRYTTEYVYAGGIAYYGNYTVSDCASETVFNFNVSLDYDIYCSAGTMTNYYYSTQPARCYGSVSYSGGWRVGAKELPYHSKNYTNGQQYLESNFSDLDFNNNWMITPDGPRPQGIMNADGICLSKTSYTAPTCTAEGVAGYQDQYGNTTSESLPKLPHTLVNGVCTNEGCGRKPVKSLTLLYDGETVQKPFEADAHRSYQLTAEVNPTDATDLSVSWSSSDETVATVSQDGLVTALADGTCYITATAADDVTKTFRLIVTETDLLNKIKVANATATVGDSSVKTAVSFATDKAASSLYCVLQYPDCLSLLEVTPVDFAYAEIEDVYTRNGYTTATVSAMYAETEAITQYHTFKPFELIFNVSKQAAPGDMRIAVTEATRLIGNESHPFETSLTGIVTLAPKLAEAITITGDDAISAPTQYSAAITPDFASDQTVTWSVDNPEIATVDAYGIVTPLTNGTLALTATANDGSGITQTKTIEVTAPEEQLAIIGENEITVPTQYNAVLLPEYVDKEHTDWSVSDETVATVDENGLVTPLKNGRIILTATTTDENGLTATKSIVITVSVRADSITSNIGLWDKAFDSDVVAYSLYVPQGTQELYLTTSFQNATARINDSVAVNGIAKKIALTGDTTELQIMLTPMADNPLRQNTYTISVIRCDGTKTLVSQDGKSFTVHPLSIADGSTVILALYNGSKLVEVQKAVAYGDALLFTTTKTYTRAKVMAVGSLNSLTPLCSAETLN